MSPKVGVVIPAFRAESTIKAVLQSVPAWVSRVFVIDDESPDGLAGVVSAFAEGDDRVELIRHERNTGVGGAVLSGYRKAYEAGVEIIVKMDADGQMDPLYLPALIAPISGRKADYCKGNRFLHVRQLRSMPALRRMGNMILSFITKAASGYWKVFDPTNGYTAINSALIPLLDTERIDKRYFFESSLLIELGMLKAVVKDVSIPARYGKEKSSLSELHSAFDFTPKLVAGFCRRIWQQYFLRDFNAVSVFLFFGSFLTLAGLIWGIAKWIINAAQGIVTTAGTVMLAVVPLITGIQLLIQAVVIDIQNAPSEPISPLINRVDDLPASISGSRYEQP